MNNKAFTLIELIAVIVVLAVIGLIAFISITAIINSGQRNALQTKASNLNEAGKNYFTNRQLQGENLQGRVRFDYPAGTCTEILPTDIVPCTDEIEIKGNLPHGGYMQIYLNGDIEIAIIEGRWCAQMGRDHSSIQIKEMDLDECIATVNAPRP